MPIYEFECGACHDVFEELVRMGATGEDLSCPKCGHQRVAKKMSSFYGRSGGNGSYESVGGHDCGCGGDCGSCGSNCSCH